MCREDNTNTNQFVEYDDIAHTDDQEEEAKMKKIQKQEEEEFSGDEEDYQEVSSFWECYDRWFEKEK